MWREELQGPSVIAAVASAQEHTRIVDITSRAVPTMAELLDKPDIMRAVDEGVAQGETLSMTLDELLQRSWDAGCPPSASSSDAGDGAANAAAAAPTRLLAPTDLQAIKACGVTFVKSMVERVIEERAGGDSQKAAALREELREELQGAADLTGIVPGSAEAAELKEVLLGKGWWSQYLEVGLGVDAEVFTKAQPMSAVGFGAQVGLHRSSSWNNPEPELVLLCNTRGDVVGATLGNDVNLRDVEGRSALLLGKAKDNNASCALGPFIRLLDNNKGTGAAAAAAAAAGGGGGGGGEPREVFDLDSCRRLEIQLNVEEGTGNSGPPSDTCTPGGGPCTPAFSLQASSSVSEISRDLEDLVGQTISPSHQYPDGLALFTGTMFSPTLDRYGDGSGFTHEVGDVVTISNPQLGALVNRVQYADKCPPWTFGTRELMRNLARRGCL
eukprot:g3296.t1